jgi:amino acid permease
MSIPNATHGGNDHIASETVQTGSAFKEMPSSHPSSPDAEDVEKTRSTAPSTDSNEPPEELRRALKTRHMVMISIGGSKYSIARPQHSARPR